MKWFRKNTEIRADTDGSVVIDDPLLRALLTGGGVTKEMALQVPTVSGGIDLIGNIVASTPIKLYKEQDGKTQEVKQDLRLRLLNDETGDTLDSNQFWKAIVRDYYTGKGGYAYINREKGQYKSLHYVDEQKISLQKNTDPIFKDFDILVNGRSYSPFDFLKILRNSKDGAEGTPLTVESSKLIEVAYESLLFERNLVKRGGNKKGFLKSESRIDEPSMQTLRTAFANLYSNSSDNMVVLNKGIDFKESSDTSTEMQLNENKISNATEFSKIFHISTDAMSGKATDQDTSNLAKLAAIPLMVTIQCALNKDFLLEKEKGTYYWAFDTKELLKGDMQSRFSAYKTALDANFMQIDEVRFAEDMEPLGLNWVKLGLQDVLYDPQSKTVYTPNTNKTSVMGEESLPDGADGDTLDEHGKTDSVTITDVKNAASEVAGKTLNGAQTQSLITVAQQYQGGTLSLQQAVNIIAVSIGVTREEAADLIGVSTEQRAQPRGKDGRFASTGSSSGRKTKYAPSPQRNKNVKIQLPAKKYSRLCSTLGTHYPGLKAGSIRTIRDAKNVYTVRADSRGGFETLNISKIK